MPADAGARGSGLAPRDVPRPDGTPSLPAAQARGFYGAWLDTLEFQARGFYQKQGDRCFGELAAHAQGGARFFMQETWPPAI